jgi:ParB family chromosome partitioning protein
MGQFRNDSIFWVEIDKIRPNPYQPRHEFDEGKLRELAESIRQYGVLQPLVATRNEEIKDDEGMSVTYELVAGERRLRASKIAGLSQVPVIIRTGEDQGRMKLELAIIENLQREDLNAVDRALAFQRLASEFRYKHADIAKKVGRSREYISNTIRILSLPQEIQDALVARKITEGHTRPLLMLSDKPEEQTTLFKEVMLKHLTVRETESIARRTAIDRIRKKEFLSPVVLELERKLTDALGTRVHIEQREKGGKILIDYFSQEDLQGLMDRLVAEKKGFLNRFMSGDEKKPEEPVKEEEVIEEEKVEEPPKPEEKPIAAEETQKDEDLYSVKNFSI